jgi:MFS family permease
MVNGAFGTLGAVYAQRIGLPIASVALLMAGAVLGGALIQFPLGRISDRMDRRKVLIATCIGAIAVALVIVLLEPRVPWLVIGLVVIFGAMIYPMYAIAVAHANDYAGPDEFVRIAGGLLLLLGFGTMAGPLLAAEAMERLMPEGLFAFSAAVHLILALYILYRMSRRLPQVPREAFKGMPVPKTATPESAELDPRAQGPGEAAAPTQTAPAEEAPATQPPDEVRPGEQSDMPPVERSDVM